MQQIISRLMPGLIYIFFLISSQCFAGVKYNFAPVDHQFDSIAQALLIKEFTSAPTPDASQALTDMERIASRTNNPQLRARLLFWQTRLGQLQAYPQEAIKTLNKAKTLTREDFDYDRAFINYQLAGNHQRLGNYFTSYQLLQQAIPVFAKYGDDYSLGNSYLLLALVYHNIGEYDSALEATAKARKHYSEARFPLNRVYFMEGLIVHDPPKETALYKLSLAEGVHEPAMSIQAMLNLADIYISTNKPDSATLFLRNAETLLHEKLNNNPIFEALILHQQARIAMQRHDYAATIALIDKAEEIWERYPGEQYEPEILLLKSKALEAMGRRDEAFDALKRYQELQDSNRRVVEAKEIPKARDREAINRQREMIAEIQHLEKARRDQLYILLLGMGLLLLAVAGVLIYIWQRKKIMKVENRELRSNLEQEMIIARFNRENFEKDIQKKDCEISSSVLLLSNKNDVLSQIGEITRTFADDGKIPPEYVKQINDVVGNSLKSDDEWSRFKLHFDSVHPSFFVKLKGASEELTENDLRLCAYIRIGMRSKEIAEMLAVSPASINSNRYRLRKKLNIGKGDSLEDFIRKI